MSRSPGPWRWQNDSERVLLDSEGVMVLVQADLTQADDEDARLVEAAPEMYELLRNLRTLSAALERRINADPASWQYAMNEMSDGQNGAYCSVAVELGAVAALLKRLESK